MALDIKKKEIRDMFEIFDDPMDKYVQIIELGKKNTYDFIFSIFHPFHLVPKAAISCGTELEIPVIIKVDDAIYEKATGLKNLQRKIEKMYNSKTLQTGDKILVSNEYTKELINLMPKIESIL